MIIMDVQSLVKSFEEIKNKSENLRKEMEKEKKILELSNEIDKLKQELEELQDKSYKISYPDNGTEVYIISDLDGGIEGRKYDVSDNGDEILYELGLYFDTYEEAKQFKRERALIKKIKCWAKEQQGDWQPDWRNSEQMKHILNYNELSIWGYYGNDIFSKFPYFKSQEIAQACIDEFGDEILEVFC